MAAILLRKLKELQGKSKMPSYFKNDKEKVDRLENAGFNWLEIAELLSMSYEEVRRLAEEDEATK